MLATLSCALVYRLPLTPALNLRKAKIGVPGQLKALPGESSPEREERTL
jgi:hypothetical protein